MQEKSPYRQKKILLTALRKKCLPCRENSAYRTKKNLLTGWRKYSLPHDGKFILPCINNWSENSVRPVTVGRKNWLFSTSVDGAEASMNIYTIVEMARLYGLSRYKYIEFLLKHRPNGDMSDDELDKLAPWDPDVQKACSKSYSKDSE